MKKTLLVLLFFSFSANAKDFGTHGTTYQIVEKDFLKEIQSKLKLMQDNGELEKLQSNIRKRVENRIIYPLPIKGISVAESSKTWLFDPSVFVKHDLADQNGKVFYKAGTKVNPLDHISLSKILIFIDGNDPKQVIWAINQNKKHNDKTKLILVSGSPIELMRQNKIRFYFDQNGAMVNKFSITHVPASVEQEGRMLKIRELAL